MHHRTDWPGGLFTVFYVKKQTQKAIALSVKMLPALWNVLELLHAAHQQHGTDCTNMFVMSPNNHEQMNQRQEREPVPVCRNEAMYQTDIYSRKNIRKWWPI